MSANILLKVRIGPLVYIEIEGDSCEEVTNALKGFEKLNRRIDDMCSDLADRVYPEKDGRPRSTTEAQDEV